MLATHGLKQRGLTDSHIARELGISHATASRDLKRCHTLWAEDGDRFLRDERLRSPSTIHETERVLRNLLDVTVANSLPNIDHPITIIRALITGQREIDPILSRAAPRSPHRPPPSSTSPPPPTLPFSPPKSASLSVLIPTLNPSPSPPA